MIAKKTIISTSVFCVEAAAPSAMPSAKVISFQIKNFFAI